MMSDSVEWYENLPEALKDAPYFKPPESGEHRTIEQVVSDLGNAAKMQGNLHNSHLRIPSADAAEEDIAKFRDKVMELDKTLTVKAEDFSPVPGEAKDYKDPDVDGFAEGELDPIRQLAVDAKWTQDQYQRYVSKLADDKTQGVENNTTWLAEQQTLIADKLGAVKDEHLSRTASALEGVLPDATLQALKDGKIEASIVLAMDHLVHKIIDMGTEDGQFEKQADGGIRPMTPDDAMERCNELRTLAMTQRPGSPEHTRTLGKLVEYQKLARQAA